MTVLCTKTLTFGKLQFASLVLFQVNEDHTNACLRIQNFANNLVIVNSRIKDHTEISESTVIFKLTSCKISVSIAEQVGLSLTRSETTKPGFLATKAYMIKGFIIYL